MDRETEATVLTHESTAMDLDNEEDEEEEIVNPNDTLDAMVDENGEKIKYKSWRKKYRKMERVFHEQMKISDELHNQDVQAKRIFNRILRQKTQVVDMLIRLNTEHLPEELSVKLQDEVGDDDKIFGDSYLSAFGRHYRDLVDRSFEYISDERALPTPRNPVGLIEWLKRNQPQALTGDPSISEKPTTSKAKKPSGATGAAATTTTTATATTTSSNAAAAKTAKNKRKAKDSLDEEEDHKRTKTK